MGRILIPETGKETRGKAGRERREINQSIIIMGSGSEGRLRGGFKLVGGVGIRENLSRWILIKRWQ